MLVTAAALKLLSGFFVSKALAAHAAARAGGGAGVRASFFVFCRGIATETAHSLPDPSSPRTRVGQKGRLLPHEAPFSFSEGPPLVIRRKVFSLASGSTSISRALPWPEHRHVRRLGCRADPLDHQFSRSSSTTASWPNVSSGQSLPIEPAADGHKLEANARPRTSLPRD